SAWRSRTCAAPWLRRLDPRDVERLQARLLLGDVADAQRPQSRRVGEDDRRVLQVDCLARRQEVPAGGEREGGLVRHERGEAVRADLQLVAVTRVDVLLVEVEDVRGRITEPERVDRGVPALGVRV